MNCKLVPLVFLFCTLVASRGIAQQPLNLSECFPLMLQQHHNFDSLTQLELSYLARFSEDDWNAHQKQGGGAIYGIAAVNYAQFDQQRTQIFSEKRLDISYYQHILSSSVTLDPAAYDVMKECIKTKAQQQQGLRWVAVAKNEKDIDLQFYYNYCLTKGIETARETDAPEIATLLGRRELMYSLLAAVAENDHYRALAQQDKDEAFKMKRSAIKTDKKLVPYTPDWSVYSLAVPMAEPASVSSNDWLTPIRLMIRSSDGAKHAAPSIPSCSTCRTPFGFCTRIRHFRAIIRLPRRSVAVDPRRFSLPVL
jgi:hypothetical protein